MIIENRLSKEVYDQVIKDTFTFMLPTVRGGGVWREAQSVLKAISSVTSTETREYLLLEAHNLLPTGQRIWRLKKPGKTENDKCEDCKEIDSVKHLISCRTTASVLSKLKRELGKKTKNILR